MRRNTSQKSQRRCRATSLLVCIGLLFQRTDVFCFTTTHYHSSTRILFPIGVSEDNTLHLAATSNQLPAAAYRPTITAQRRTKLILHTAEKAADLSNHDNEQGNNNNSNNDETIPGIWPCFDELDTRLIKIALPVIANFAINPLIGAVDLFWINRMGNALAVAGQAAANQVFNSAFWLASFLPSGEYLPCRMIRCILYLVPLARMHA